MSNQPQPTEGPPAVDQGQLQQPTWRWVSLPGLMAICAMAASAAAVVACGCAIYFTGASWQDLPYWVFYSFGGGVLGSVAGFLLLYGLSFGRSVEAILGVTELATGESDHSGAPLIFGGLLGAILGAWLGYNLCDRHINDRFAADRRALIATASTAAERDAAAHFFSTTGALMTQDAQGRVRGLQLEHREMDADIWAYVVALPDLESLSLQSCQLDEEGLARLRGSKHLKELSIRRCSLASDRLGGLRAVKSIEHLDLSHMHLANDDLADIAALPRLTHLSLEMLTTNPGATGAKRPGKKRETLRDETTSPGLSDAALTHLYGHAWLEQIDLGGRTGITDGAIAELKKYCPKLERVER